MAQSSFIPGNPNLITETLYKKQEDYAFVNNCKAEIFRQNSQFVRERDGPFIQAYYQHYEADIPYKNAVFSPQVKPFALAHRQCNPLVAYPYGMPRNVTCEKCTKCKGNKKHMRKRKVHRKSKKNANVHEGENLANSNLKVENCSYELQEKTNDDFKNNNNNNNNMDCILVHNNDYEGDIGESLIYYSNAPPFSNNVKEIYDDNDYNGNDNNNDNDDMRITEQYDADDINNNGICHFINEEGKESVFDSYIGNKIYEKMRKHFSQELHNSLHLNIENEEYTPSVQNLITDIHDMYKDLNTNMDDDESFQKKKKVIMEKEQYYLKLNDEKIENKFNIHNKKSDAVTDEVKYDTDKEEVKFNELTYVSNENIEQSQTENSDNGNERKRSTSKKSLKQQTYDDDVNNVPSENDSKKENSNQEFTGAKENSKNIKQVYICDDVKTVNYHVEKPKTSKEDVNKSIIKKNKNKINEASSITNSKGKEENEQQQQQQQQQQHIKKNKGVSQHPEQTKKPSHTRVCHVEVMLSNKEKMNVCSRQKRNNQNKLQPSVTNVEEFFPDEPKKISSKNKIFRFPVKNNKEGKDKIEGQIVDINTINEEPLLKKETFKLIHSEASNSSKAMNSPIHKNKELTNINNRNSKSPQKLSNASLLKYKTNVNGYSRKQTNKKVVMVKSNEDILEKNLSNKSNNQEANKKKKTKRLLSRSTTVFYGDEKTVPFKTTEVKRFTKHNSAEVNKLENLISNEYNNISIKTKKTKNFTKNKKDSTIQVSNSSKQLKSEIIKKKMKSKKNELYDNILSLTDNIKNGENSPAMNKKKGDIKLSLQNSMDKEENIHNNKNVDNNNNNNNNSEVPVKTNFNKLKTMKRKISVIKQKEENKNMERGMSTYLLKYKMKTAKNIKIKENSKEVKKEEKKKRVVST